MFLRYNMLGILWTIFIMILCGMPGGDFPDLSFWSLLTFDKVAHAFVFAVLVVLLTVGFIRQYRYRGLRYRAIEVAFGFSSMYAILTELLQGMVFKDRYSDIMDLAANLIGCVIGVLVFKMIYRGVHYIK